MKGRREEGRQSKGLLRVCMGAAASPGLQECIARGAAAKRGFREAGTLFGRTVRVVFCLSLPPHALLAG